MTGRMIAGLALALAVTASAAAKDGPSLSLTSGVDFSRGDYGLPADTSITVVPNSARLTTGNLALTASLPWIRLKSPGGVVLGPDGRPLPGLPTTAPRRTSGLGDLSLGARYTLDGLGPVDIGVGGRVKLPTSDTDKGLSTGKTDVGGSVEFSGSFGAVSPFVELGYRMLGDPAGTSLRDGPTLSAGTSVQLGKAVLITSYDYARSATSAVEDSQELFGGIAVPAGERFTITGYGTKGLSQGSADYGAGLLLTAKVF